MSSTCIFVSVKNVEQKYINLRAFYSSQWYTWENSKMEHQILILLSRITHLSNKSVEIILITYGLPWDLL